MKRILLPLMLALATGAAFAHNCPNEIKAIDAKLAAYPQLSEAEAAKVKQLRAEGEAAHKAGKHDDAMKALGEAKKILSSEDCSSRVTRPARPGVLSEMPARAGIFIAPARRAPRRPPGREAPTRSRRGRGAIRSSNRTSRCKAARRYCRPLRVLEPNALLVNACSAARRCAAREEVE